jgi:hypothetical protein
MVQLQKILQNLLRRAENWGVERGDLFANLPDNPWTYPGCGVHVKASDIFSGDNYLKESGSVPDEANGDAEGLTV